VDRGTELQSVRELRTIALRGDMSARLALCRLYAAGKYGGCARQQAVNYVREFVQSSSVLDVCAMYSGTELTHSMRSVGSACTVCKASKPQSKVLMVRTLSWPTCSAMEQLSSVSRLP